ncbi:Hypothetical_protein [Hexamita inflata]|uniref:Hypothetical_protein n=1 Tax=Hexamita inflata TaxID=28002 RepID=A0AA86U440_9EUKA|nr:Hypothetical protein HINF_LOCUS24887 [Hexamita inflata]
MQFQVLTGSLLCIICDVDVQRCNLIFIAYGQQISGMIIEPKDSFSVQQSFIQYRLSSMNASGLTNIINQSSLTYIISNCKLTGSNLIQNKYNGYIASTIFVIIQLNITQFYICVDQTTRFGQESVQISIIGSENVQCDICDKQSVIYGLCVEDLQYSQSINGMYQCVHPFEYVDNRCVCAYGYLLNKTNCINVVEQINLMHNLTNDNNREQLEKLKQNIENIYHQLEVLDQNVLNNISIIENKQNADYSLADYNLLTNTSILDNRIYQNITSLNTDMLKAYNQADSNLLSNTTILDQRIYTNVSYLQNIINNLTSQLNSANNSLSQQKLIIEQQKYLMNQLTQQINCASNYGFQIVDGLCIQVTCVISGQKSINGACQCTTTNAIVQSGSCVCPPDQVVINNACQYVINESIYEQQCSYEIYNTFFDIQSVTNQISSNNFSVGYVFSSSTEIQNAFIDVSDNVYTTVVQPLFQSKTAFYNLKIQFGSQSLISGSFIISSSTVIKIAQMNILSRSGSQITVSSASQLNIITSSSTSANISNLLVNLSFAASNGNITLFSDIKDIFNISGYQVLGTYVSTQTVAMIGLNFHEFVKLSPTLNVNQVSFKPNVYNVGNSSSYLLTRTDQSTVIVTNLAIIMGNSSNFQLLGSISSTLSNFYMFGGVINYNYHSLISIHNVILDSFQHISSDYIGKSGYLLGYLLGSIESTQIINVCLQQNITSTTLKFSSIGLIGCSYNNLLLQNTSIIFSVQGAQFWCLGVVGLQNSNAQIFNLQMSMNLSESITQGGNIGSLFGIASAATIKNATLYKSNLTSCNAVGGLIGLQTGIITFLNTIITKLSISTGAWNVGGFIAQSDGNANFVNSTISESNISTTSSRYVGGLIGSSKNINLMSVKIIQIRLSGVNATFGIVSAENLQGSQIISGSLAVQNYIKDVLQSDCSVLANAWSVTGC